MTTPRCRMAWAYAALAAPSVGTRMRSQARRVMVILAASPAPVSSRRAPAPMAVASSSPGSNCPPHHPS
eukprot:4695311-Lingulodinium_polyedra.AAC.1